MATGARTTRSRETSVSDLAARHSRRRRATQEDVEVKPRRKRSSTPRRNTRRKAHREAEASRRAMLVFAKGIATLVLLAAIITVGAIAFRSFVGSDWFSVKHIEFEGNERTSREELAALVQAKVSGGLWKADLNEIRTALKSNAWIRDVEVTRMPPDRLRVRINERSPFVLSRRENGDVVWLDQDGTVLGDQTRFKVEDVPPLVSGLPEGIAPKVIEKRRQHLMMVQQMLNDFGSAPGVPAQTRLVARVDEITYVEGKGFELLVSNETNGQDPVRVLIGTQDFAKRLTVALRILEAVARRDVSTLQLFKLSDAERLLQGVPVHYINATLPDRAIIGLAE